MIFLVVVLAIVAVAVIGYGLASSSQTPSAPTSLPTTPTPTPTLPEIPQPTPIEVTPIPQDQVNEGAATPDNETEATSQETQTPEDYSSPANNAIEDGIHDAYFAKEVYEKTGNTQAKESPYSYTFNNNQDFSGKTKETVAAEILSIISEELNGRNVFAKEHIILQALTASSYKGKNQNDGNGDTIQFHVFDMELVLQKVNSAPLGQEVFVVAKSYNLIDKEATITIHEKEELLVDKDAPLNVIEAKENDDDASELTELKATFNADGIAKIKIKLRPKSDDDLKTWTEKLKGGSEDGTHSYTANNEFKVETEAERTTIAATIETNSNKALAPNHIVKKEDIIALLTVGSTYSIVENIPKYKKGAQTEYLWLKVSCDGDEQCHVGEFLKEEGKYFILGGICECEAKMKAFMRMIRVGEGTADAGGYTRIVGGASFSDMSAHPRTFGQGSSAAENSTAAGAYQITVTNWDGYPALTTFIEKHNLGDFSRISQDIYCVFFIIEKRKAFDLIMNDDIENAIYKCSNEWVSLPGEGAGSGQRQEKIDDALANYEKYLKEELSGNIDEDSKVHIPSGFLKKYFNKGCCNDEASGNWHHPLDRMELRVHYGSTSQGASNSDHGPAPNRNSGSHDGLDLYAPIGTTVYACVDGEIYEDYISATYGNTLGIKGDYNGTTYYFFYAHLSSRSVSKGDTVKAGDNIGQTGVSGNAGTPHTERHHLHFEVRNTSARTGGRVDPLTTITELGTDVDTNPDSNTQT